MDPCCHYKTSPRTETAWDSLPTVPPSWLPSPTWNKGKVPKKLKRKTYQCLFYPYKANIFLLFPSHLLRNALQSLRMFGEKRRKQTYILPFSAYMYICKLKFVSFFQESFPKIDFFKICQQYIVAISLTTLALSIISSIIRPGSSPSSSTFLT